jgi:hypothetical protein
MPPAELMPVRIFGQAEKVPSPRRLRQELRGAFIKRADGGRQLNVE